MRVGVFDSGVGGLTVVKSLLEHHLFSEIIYYGDTARVPYGTKDKNTIVRYSLEALEFFKNFEIDLLITACNTVSAYALEAMNEVAPFPVIGVVKSGVKATIAKASKDDEILIIATRATVDSKTYQTLLLEQGYRHIEALATPLFVPIVEEGIFEGEVLQSAFNHYFKGIKKPDTIILGCTHFPLIAKQIANYFNHDVTLVHSGEAIVDELKAMYSLEETYEQTSLKLFASQDPDGLKKTAKMWLDNYSF
jgi:glutamate racemase